MLAVPDPTNPLGYEFSKDRLTRGWSYPVKRSHLDRALIEAGISAVSHVTYNLDTRSLSDPHRPPLAVAYMGSPRFMIFVKSVPSDVQPNVAQALEERLSDVAEWMASIHDRPPTWRSEWHTLRVILTGDGLQLAEDPPPA
jgi:hypothetical protein